MKNLLLSFLALFCFTFTAQAQDEGGFQFGAGVNLIDVSEAIGIQGKALYGLNENIELGGAFTYILDDILDMQIDINAQYRGLNVSDSFRLQPLAGISYLRASAGGFSVSNTALHIGASFRFVLESGMNIYVEPILVVDDGSGLNIAGGILF